MRKIIFTLALLFAVYLPTSSYAAGESPDQISADPIRRGCFISFSKELHPVADDPLSTPPFDILANWRCNDGEQFPIDKYEINGSSPEVTTVFYWKNRSIIVLVKWPTNSQAADYEGDYYKVFIYRYSRVSDKSMLTRDDSSMRNFPPGWNGSDRNGKPLSYPFKDAASIRKKLRTIQFN
ncbi:MULTISPECIES: hypothetical protein [Burkholderiaceae]|uniref:hypothetical protein n=1 Tax=Burkholderiaceae TaxID=119060 RepID=UPI00115FF907|nr:MULTISPECIES: hypothetical protein [Burkholderiaceae]